MDEFITVCPRNCYSTCSFKVQVENNKIRRILPCKENLATPEGPCIKGLSYIERAHSSQRIIHPLLKTSNGSFRQITLTEALNIISEKLSDIKRKNGPQSILWYRGSGISGLTNEIGNSFWRSFGGATTTYGNLCWPAGLEAVRLTLGSVKHNAPWDLENARTIIIWGKNPAETNIQEMAFIASAWEKGSRIIVIDPRRTPTADKADMLVSPVPGTDGALALAIARILINNNHINKSFIERYVSGFNEFINNLKITPEDAENITGIPVETIVELANIIAMNSPVTFLPGYGLQRHSNGGQTIRSVLSLAVLTGNIGKSGSGFNYANLQSYIFDSMKEPLSYYPDPVKDLPFRRVISMAKLGEDILKTSNPEIKAAWIERGNPLIQSPDTNTVRAAFAGMEFKVVVDQFMTDTASIADIILPAKDMFEQSDIVSSYWSPYIHFKPKILKAEGEVIPESEIYFHLAKRLNLQFNDKQIPEPGNDNIERWLEYRIRDYTDLTLNDLQNGPVIAPGYQEIAYEDMKFDTPSGKIELFSAAAEEKWGISPLPEYISNNLQECQQKYPLIFITPNTGSRIHSQFGNLDIIRSITPEPALEISPIDASRRNILSGDIIKIFNDRGEIKSLARISNRVPSGSVILPNGIWMDEWGGGNLLVSPEETDMGYGAAFHDTRVEVMKVN
ncbi:MAG: molybdopterin-dependent oxidoreductase [Bacteroidales bacterium]|nr:molybdopterin-dependent oxidoreductase [Bacteroidales bacterium]